MYIAGSFTDGVCVFRLDGHHSIAINNLESWYRQHANSDIDLRANANLCANVAANNRTVASPYDCFANCCFATYFDASPCERNADASP